MKPLTITKITIKDTEDGGVTTLIEYEGAFDPDDMRPSQAFANELLEGMRSADENGYAVTVKWTKKDVEKHCQRKF